MVMKRLFLMCCAALPLLSLSACDVFSKEEFKKCFTKSEQEFSEMMKVSTSEYLEQLKNDSTKRENIKSINACFDGSYKKAFIVNTAIELIKDQTDINEKLKEKINEKIKVKIEEKERIIDFMEILNKVSTWQLKLNNIAVKLDSNVNELTIENLDEFKDATKSLEFFLASKISAIDTLFGGKLSLINNFVSSATSAANILSNLNRYKEFSLDLVKSGNMSPEDYVKFKDMIEEIAKELNFSGVDNAFKNVDKINASLQNVYDKLLVLSNLSGNDNNKFEDLRNAISGLKSLLASEKVKEKEEEKKEEEEEVDSANIQTIGSP